MTEMSPWFACEEPERPTNAAVRWHYEGCVGCQIKAEALASQHPDDPHVAWLNTQMREAEFFGIEQS